MNKLEFTKFPPLDYVVAESINTLCTNITFLGSSYKRILITSCHASEGKSFVALNIMRTFAGLRKKVILVDADIRRSTIAMRYRIKGKEKNRFGLTHYLAGMCEKEDILYETSIPGALFVPAGHLVSNSLSLLSSRSMSSLLNALSGQADYVIVDAAPVGIIIDAAEIAKSCDGALFVVKYNAVHRRELRDARQQIEQTGCPIMGAVLNNVELSKYSNRKYYYKSYYARYGDEYNDQSGRFKIRTATRSKNGIR
jgi:capsular exopolysaccharide synthesis family protein